MDTSLGWWQRREVHKPAHASNRALIALTIEKGKKHMHANLGH